MKRSVLIVLAVIFVGCAAARPPVESVATTESDQYYSGPICPVGCVERYGVTNPYILDTDIEYLQLMMWRYWGATEDALEAENDEEARTILAGANADTLRLRQEYTEWWNDHPLEQDCYYCGPVCQEMNLLLLHSPVTDSHPICPTPAPSSTAWRPDSLCVVQ